MLTIFTFFIWENFLTKRYLKLLYIKLLKVLYPKAFAELLLFKLNILSQVTKNCPESFWVLKNLKDIEKNINKLFKIYKDQVLKQIGYKTILKFAQL